MIAKFFTWVAGMLSDPADRQGSTHRACLTLLILVVCLVLFMIGVAVCHGKQIDIPPEAASLVKFLVTALIGGIAWAKGTAAAVSIKGAPSSVPPAVSEQGA